MCKLSVEETVIRGEVDRADEQTGDIEETGAEACKCAGKTYRCLCMFETLANKSSLLSSECS